jgi:membrane fusion protein (multidrug efflux system)
MRFHLSLGLVAVLACLDAGCSGPYSKALATAAKGQDRAAEVKIEVARLESLPEIVTATGELFAEDTATISAKVPGRVAKLNVDLGSKVEPGQVLAEIERDDYEFRVKQSEALVEQTRARLGLKPSQPDDAVVSAETATVKLAVGALENAKLNFERVSRLVKEGVFSQADFDSSRSTLLQAEARYQSAQEEVLQAQAQLVERRALLALARQQLDDTLVRAPFVGAVTRRPASLGEYLATNAPIVTIVRSHPLRLRLEVPERLAYRVQVGQQVEVHVEGTNTTRSGRVVRLSPAIEAQNRSLLVEGEIPNADGVLRAGAFAEGVITVNAAARGLVVPARTVLSTAGVDRLFVVENGAAVERLVKPGRRLPGERLEILSGLQAGERVVVEGQERLSPGQKVEAGGG